MNFLLGIFVFESLFAAECADESLGLLDRFRGFVDVYLVVGLPD